ncbi:MAG: DUF3562 domain-containing protein [Proteobacteria bacterium]|nr:DUF3562 domain-containing protein [Pseudomonadota bacterium]
MTIYLDEAERQRHRNCIEAMALELHRPVEEITLFYEDALSALSDMAHVRDYLPILVAKNVRRALGANVRQR